MPSRILTALGGALIIVASSVLPIVAQSQPEPGPLHAPGAPAVAYVDAALIYEPADIGLATTSAVTYAPEASSLLVAGQDPSGQATVV